jgi:hypothetical protein
MDSVSDCDGNVTGGRSKGVEGGTESLLASMSTDRPSSDVSVNRGISSEGVAVSGEIVNNLSGTAGGFSDVDVPVDEVDNLGRDPCVLLLNLDGSDWLKDIMLSLFPPESVPLLNKLWRAVRSNTFFSVKGKYSVKCVVMSSLGGL